MDPIEIIRLRTAGEKEQVAMKWLLETVPTLLGLPCLKEAVICHGLSAPTDLILLLRWDGVELHARGSDAAVTITEGSSVFGLANHTIWSISESFHPGPACMNQFQGRGLDVKQHSDAATRIREKRET